MSAPLTSDHEADECWSVDGSDFRYQSLDDLLDSNDQLEVGNEVEHGEKVHRDPGEWVEADDVIENLSCRGGDEGGEWADDYPDIPPAAKLELQDFLEEWARKYAQPGFYSVRNVKKYTITAEDLA